MQAALVRQTSMGRDVDGLASLSLSRPSVFGQDG